MVTRKNPAGESGSVSELEYVVKYEMKYVLDGTFDGLRQGYVMEKYVTVHGVQNTDPVKTIHCGGLRELSKAITNDYNTYLTQSRKPTLKVRNFLASSLKEVTDVTEEIVFEEGSADKNKYAEKLNRSEMECLLMNIGRYLNTNR